MKSLSSLYSSGSTIGPSSIFLKVLVSSHLLSFNIEWHWCTGVDNARLVERKLVLLHVMMGLLQKFRVSHLIHHRMAITLIDSTCYRHTLVSSFLTSKSCFQRTPMDPSKMRHCGHYFSRFWLNLTKWTMEVSHRTSWQENMLTKQPSGQINIIWRWSPSSPLNSHYSQQPRHPYHQHSPL